MPCEVTAAGYLPSLMRPTCSPPSDQPRQAASTMKHLAGRALPKGPRQLGGGSDGLRGHSDWVLTFGVRPRARCLCRSMRHALAAQLTVLGCCQVLDARFGKEKCR
jgi:hypothetical protein